MWPRHALLTLKRVHILAPILAYQLSRPLMIIMICRSTSPVWLSCTSTLLPLSPAVTTWFSPNCFPLQSKHCHFKYHLNLCHCLCTLQGSAMPHDPNGSVEGIFKFYHLLTHLRVWGHRRLPPPSPGQSAPQGQRHPTGEASELQTMQIQETPLQKSNQYLLGRNAAHHRTHQSQAQLCLSKWQIP